MFTFCKVFIINNPTNFANTIIEEVRDMFEERHNPIPVEPIHKPNPEKENPNSNQNKSEQNKSRG